MIDYECMLDEKGRKLVGFGVLLVLGLIQISWDKRKGKDQLKRALIVVVMVNLRAL